MTTPPARSGQGKRAAVSDNADTSVRLLLQRAEAAGLFPAAVARWGRGSISVGRGDLVHESLPVSPDTWFDLASLTKPLVTSTLTLLTFRSGEIGPATTVGKVLPELRQAPVGALRIHDLLTHSSGLPAWLPLYCLCEGRTDALVERLGGIELEARPGSRVVYSCIGFVILGLILEVISGVSLDELFIRQVAEPLGIGDRLGFFPDSAIHRVAAGSIRPLAEERMVRDLGLDPRWVPPVGPGLPDDGNSRFLGGCSGNSGLFGCVDGVYRLAREYGMKGGGLLTSEEAALATRNHTPALEQDRGYGWQCATSPGCSAGPGLVSSAVGHTGFTGTSVWLEPGNGSCWVLLSNRNHPVHRGSDLHSVRRRFHSLAGVERLI